MIYLLNNRKYFLKYNNNNFLKIKILNKTGKKTQNKK